MISRFFQGWVKRSHGEWLTLPLEHLEKHVLVIGQPGAGKTETLLRIASLVREHYGWQVIYLDLKGDEETQRRFVACMQGIPEATIRTFPASHWDGWRGDNAALYNRLLAIQDFSEPYYKNAAKIMLSLAINAPAGRPRNSEELLARLDLDTLKGMYKERPEASKLESIATKDAKGAAMRYWAFFRGMDGWVDGTLGYEDADALYIMVPGFAQDEDAKSFGRYLITDFVSYAATRKQRSTKTLFVIDEINTLEMETPEAYSPFEKARGFGASVMASAQTYESLGKYRQRIAGASHLLILHRCPDPDELVQRAGKEKRVTASYGIDSAFARGQMQLKQEYVVDPSEVRRLGAGEVFTICQGFAQKARVARMEVTDTQLEQAKRLIAQEQAIRERIVDGQVEPPPQPPPHKPETL